MKSTHGRKSAKRTSEHELPQDQDNGRIADLVHQPPLPAIKNEFMVTCK